MGSNVATQAQRNPERRKTIGAIYRSVAQTVNITTRAHYDDCGHDLDLFTLTARSATEGRMRRMLLLFGAALVGSFQACTCNSVNQLPTQTGVDPVSSVAVDPAASASAGGTGAGAPSTTGASGAGTVPAGSLGGAGGGTTGPVGAGGASTSAPAAGGTPSVKPDAPGGLTGGAALAQKKDGGAAASAGPSPMDTSRPSASGSVKIPPPPQASNRAPIPNPKLGQ